MKKPSERIEEIAYKIWDESPVMNFVSEAYPIAIAQYLDEQHAKDLELADFTNSGGERKE